MAHVLHRVSQKAQDATGHIIAKAGERIWREPPDGTFLHGTVHVVAHAARNLPNVDLEYITGKTDAYVRLIIDGKKGPRTSTIANDLNPVWEEELKYRVGWRVATVTLKLKDQDIGLLSKKVGIVHIPIEVILQKRIVNTWLPVGKGAELRVTAWFIDAQEEAAYTEVPSEFSELSGNVVTLFQDAHVPKDTHVPDVLIAAGEYKKYNCLWETLYRTIQQARHFIYITGWAVWADLYLLREQPLGPEGFVTLGNLLKQKADEGVAVLLLVWDELMSIDSKALNSILTVTKTGLLRTHDSQTKAYFRGSNVNCQLVLRRGKGTSTLGNVSCVTNVLAWVAAEAVFSHHQKSITCDAPCYRTGKRRVVTFIGGLDLTDGRFDTPEHPIFRTLKTWHQYDFYQGYGAYNPDYGPRQPWHDVHALIEGPVAWDVVCNFEQRWRKQAPKHVSDLVDFSSLPFVRASESQYHVPGSWNCQMFRSIDSYSADLPKKGIEHSIYDAYVHQIRRAEHFIYIENQYFLGSSQDWEGFDEREWNVECKHRIPAELATQIVAHIRAGKRFAVYVVIPMHPEGVPEEPAMQAILHWQYKTISFMYRSIAGAIQEYGPPGAQPTDYLNFYFLGQREPGPEFNLPNPVDPRQAKQSISRRQMIYVHSKLMIVDDEYLIIGSANINERSMAGDRDTEICVGMYQPDFMRQGSRLPGGQVAGFRLSLWGEHTGIYENIFHYPSTADCVHRINQLADFNWHVFSGDHVLPMAGHLCRYPYRISPEGGVYPVQACFPDMEQFNATIVGAPQAKVPNIFTT